MFRLPPTQGTGRQGDDTFSSVRPLNKAGLASYLALGLTPREPLSVRRGRIELPPPHWQCDRLPLSEQRIINQWFRRDLNSDLPG